MSKAIGMFFYLNPVLNSLVGQFNTYPKLTSGSADSCNGFTFPGCPEWFVSSDGASYHSNVTVALEEEARKIEHQQEEEAHEQADASIQSELIQGLLMEEQAVA